MDDLIGKDGYLIEKDGYNKSLMEHVYGSLEGCCIIETVEDNDFSPFGNSYVEITEEDIAALRKGKVLKHCDGEYCHFLVMNTKNGENE